MAIIKDSVPDDFWLVEVSVPELYPINKEKLGELIVDSHCKGTIQPSLVRLIHVPGLFIIPAPNGEEERNFMPQCPFANNYLNSCLSKIAYMYILILLAFINEIASSLSLLAMTGTWRHYLICHCEHSEAISCFGH
ncbi:MAG TPA: hypothetical protein ENN18_03230 [Proteobacteria bacterium]|nr:hypothetical protein [Pseudomonadota bacterium]